VSLHQPRARTPAHRCKHVCFGMRLRSCLPAEAATLVRLRRYTGAGCGVRLVVAAHDYTQMESACAFAHYGLDHMMVDDIVAFLKDDIKRLPVGVVDAMEAGLVAMAMDEARITGNMVDITPTWTEIDQYGLKP
jgi:hypothetical protein